MTEDKVLKIRVDGMDGSFEARANHGKAKETDADFVGEGVRVWLNEARPRETEPGKDAGGARPIVRAQRL